jgi:hypothetical protein
MRGVGGGTPPKKERLPSIRRVKRAAGGCHGNMPLRNGKKRKEKKRKSRAYFDFLLLDEAEKHKNIRIMQILYLPFSTITYQDNKSSFYLS